MILPYDTKFYDVFLTKTNVVPVGVSKTSKRYWWVCIVPNCIQISSMGLAGWVSLIYLILLRDAYGDRGWVAIKFINAYGCLR